MLNIAKIDTNILFRMGAITIREIGIIKEIKRLEKDSKTGKNEINKITIVVKYTILCLISFSQYL